MATKSAVAAGVLPQTNGNTVDLTVSGFGTVSAAIIIASNANSTSNPQDAARLSLGFWDGVHSTQRCCYVISENNTSASQTVRFADTTHAVRFAFDGTTAESNPTYYTASAVTDGIRLTKNAGTVSADRYVTAILIGGASNVYVGSVSLGTGTSAIDVTAPGFEPSAVFFLSHGCSDNEYTQGGLIGIGAAHYSSANVLTQASIHFASVDAESAAQKSGCYVTETYCGGQYYNGAFSYYLTAGSFDASGFSVTPSASASSDTLYYLAIKFPDDDDFWLDTIDAKQSTGTQAYTGTGFTPQAIGLVGSMATALDTHTDSGTFVFGATDRTTQRAIGIVDADNVATSDTDSYANSSNVYYLRQDGPSDEAIAAYSSFDSNGFTLNFSDGASAARKILAFAIGDSAGGGGATGSFAVTDKVDTSAFAGAVPISGSFTGIDSPDTSALAGDVLIAGSFTGTDLVDTAAFAGSVASAGAPTLSNPLVVSVTATSATPRV